MNRHKIGREALQSDFSVIVFLMLRSRPEDKIEHITYPGTLEGGDVMMCGNHFYVGRSERTNKDEFKTYNRYVIPEEEAYAANCIWVNGTVIVPEGYPAVLELVRAMGYETLTVDTSEFKKLDGGLSCLSLRF